jgi:hypothetical protein
MLFREQPMYHKKSIGLIGALLYTSTIIIGSDHNKHLSEDELKVHTVSIYTNQERAEIRRVSDPFAYFCDVNLEKSREVATDEDFEEVITVQQQIPHHMRQRSIILLNNKTLKKDELNPAVSRIKYEHKNKYRAWNFIDLPLDTYNPHEKTFVLTHHLMKRNWEDYQPNYGINLAEGASLVLFGSSILVLGLTFLFPNYVKEGSNRRFAGYAGVGLTAYALSRTIGNMNQPYTDSVYKADEIAVHCGATPVEKIAIAKAGEELLMQKRKNNSWYENFCIDFVSLFHSNQPTEVISEKRIRHLRAMAAEQKKRLATHTPETKDKH